MSTDDTTIGSGHAINGGNIAIDGMRLPVRMFFVLLVIEVLLVLLDAFVTYARWSDYSTIRRLFNITREDSLATWFMVMQTFGAGVVLWTIFLLQRNRQVSRGRIAGWGFLAAFFTYLSADDGAKIHERLGTLAEKMFEADRLGAGNSLLGKIMELFPSYEWQLVVLPLLVGAGLFMLFFLWREFGTRGERLILFAAAGCMAFAVGLDFVEGLERSHPLNVGIWIRDALDLRTYTVEHFSKSLEEFLEMVAISMLLMLFLQHLIKISGTHLTFHFQKNTL